MKFVIAAAFAALAAASAPPALAANEPVTAAGVVAGTMSIEFATRDPRNRSDGEVNEGVRDVYTVDLKVLGDYGFANTIERQPRVGDTWSMLGLSDEQRAGFRYGVDLTFRTRKVGNLVGFVGVAEDGTYTLADEASPLRLDVQAGKAPFISYFKGSIKGLPVTGSSDATSSLLRQIRVIGRQDGRTVARDVAVEPFDARLTLAKGVDPGRFPETAVTGSLNYDRETANYYPRLEMSYRIDGQDVTDVVEGNIRWNEEQYRYEFNVTFAKTSADTAVVEDFFEESAAASDDDFFAVDASVPALTGSIAYKDTGESEAGPLSSVATYQLDANNLTPAQIMNFMKFWLLAVGPTNDE